MRTSRLKIIGQSACYHVICRITQGQSWLGQEEKAHLMELLHRVANYCGVEVVTFCIMSNHFHLLLKVTEKVAADASLTDEQLLNRVTRLYGSEAAQQLRGMAQASPHLWEQERAVHVARMHELSVFMKLLKQRFTLWHNSKHGTRGTLWTERFKSLLVEAASTSADEPNPLEVVAAYIDLNPVRAGIVAEARDYGFSGLGSAFSGNTESQRGIMALANAHDWSQAGRWYEQLLSLKSPVLRSRQGALVKGLVLGTAGFVVDVLLTIASLRRRIPRAFATGDMGLWVGCNFHRNARPSTGVRPKGVRYKICH